MCESDNLERLSRFLAHAGVASRRLAEALIAAGRVQVNGSVITTQGTQIDPTRDSVQVDGKLCMLLPVMSIFCSTSLLGIFARRMIHRVVRRCWIFCHEKLVNCAYTRLVGWMA